MDIDKRVEIAARLWADIGIHTTTASEAIEMTYALEKEAYVMDKCRKCCESDDNGIPESSACGQCMDDMRRIK